METPNQSYERPRPHHARTASRSSTSTTNTRMTSQSVSSSTSQIVSPQLTTSHSTHRFHHASCAKPTTPRPTPRLSREASIESTRQTAVSSFLQERLQRERRAESEKLAASASRSTLDNHSSTDLRLHQSPTKNSESERRPQSSASSEKRGLGVKDMEQVISGLHKQNFDLKLELYHRRERQTALEQRVELLESEKAKTDEMNEKLAQDTEKRDKAIEEAVAMIITLEAKVEQLVKERDMVRHIEAQAHYAPFNSYETSTPESFFDDKTLARMPSFLSEKSENTENLRNVYLGVKGSMLSLPQVAEVSGDADSPASPSMSVLSESSFVSVYGQKTPEVDEPLSLDGVDVPAKASGIRRPKTSLAKPAQTRTARSNSMSMNRQLDSIPNVMDQGSPLQPMERTYTKEERPESRVDSRQNAKTSTMTKSPTARRRDEKREGLRKVLTDAPGGVRLHDHALPPTPDTISTSTLRRFQNSDDTLPKEVRNRPSLGALSDISAHDEKPSGVRLKPEPTKVRDFGTFDRPIIRRPRSAGETTVSHRGNDWDSDSDSDTKSLESSLDIWMRESAKPDGRGRASPDLFSFPSTNKGAWAMDAMFGPSAYGSATVDPEKLLEMLPAQPGVFTSGEAPPAPFRRSSRNAHTGSNQTKSGRVQKSPTRKKGRRNSDDPSIRIVTQPTPTSDKKQYPPIVNQGRNPLTKLFRRSLGGSTEGTPVEMNFADIPRSQTAMGVPSWISRDDDRDSATPPPILRNPRQSRGQVDFETEEPIIPPVEAQEGNSPRSVSAMGNRRKWLPGFGRNSLKNKG